MRILLGLVGIAIGVALAVKNEYFANTFGTPEFAVKYLGSFGGRRLFYVLLGTIVAILSVMYMTGTFGSLVRGIFGAFLPG